MILMLFSHSGSRPCGWKPLCFQLALTGMEMFIQIAIFLAAVVLYCALALSPNGTNNNNLAVSAVRLPLLGQLGLISPERPIHEIFMQWSTEYGQVFRAQLGQYNLVVINGHKLIKEALADPRFDGRPQFTLLQAISGGPKGILSSSGPSWIQTRRITVENLKNYGMGKKSLDTVMQMRIDDISSALPVGKPASLETQIYSGVTDFMWTVLTGHGMQSHQLPELLVKTARQVNIVSKGPLGFIPSLSRRLMPGYTGWTELSKLTASLQKLQRAVVQNHWDTLTEAGTQGQDLVHDVLLDLNQAQLEDHEVAVLNDILFGGSVPVASTLLWAILYLAAHPSAQRALQAEIDEIIGQDHSPSIALRPRMPYTIAVLMETLRKSSFFPLGVFHEATSNVTLNDVTIHTGTAVCFNLHGAHHDPDVWDDPEKFKPDRFIKIENGNSKLVRHQASIPFSFGGRSCTGELLAKEFLFLCLTSLFQRFEFSLSSKDDIAKILKSNHGFFNLPPEVPLVLKRR